MEEMIVAGEGFSLWNFIKKNYYWIIIILVIIPTIISSIFTAYDTRNPIYPFAKLGLRLTNSDTLINNLVNNLISNPDSVIGMAKPTSLIYFQWIKYYWLFFWNVIWEIFANLWLISVPFVLFYKLVRLKDNSQTFRNITLTALFGLGFLIFFNLIILVHSLLHGNSLISPPENLDIYQESWFIIKSILPFHGIYNLIAYLISLFYH